MNKKVISIILIIVGSIFMILTLPGIIRSYNIKKAGISAEGIVTSIAQLGRKTELKKVTVNFNTSEGESVTASASKRNYVSQGDKVMLFYDPADPLRIDFGDATSYSIRGTIIGGLIILLGLYLFFHQVFADNARNNLIRSGQKITAEFVSIIRNEKYRMGDKNPWIVKCKWTNPVNNRDYYYESMEYTVDPAPFLKERSHIDIFINPDEPMKYYMDMSFMPKGVSFIG